MKITVEVSIDNGTDNWKVKTVTPDIAHDIYMDLYELEKEQSDDPLQLSIDYRRGIRRCMDRIRNKYPNSF